MTDSINYNSLHRESTKTHVRIGSRTCTTQWTMRRLPDVAWSWSGSRDLILYYGTTRPMYFFKTSAGIHFNFCIATEYIQFFPIDQKLP